MARLTKESVESRLLHHQQELCVERRACPVLRRAATLGPRAALCCDVLRRWGHVLPCAAMLGLGVRRWGWPHVPCALAAGRRRQAAGSR
jgi:hypothetical protein